VKIIKYRTDRISTTPFAKLSRWRIGLANRRISCAPFGRMLERKSEDKVVIKNNTTTEIENEAIWLLTLLEIYKEKLK